ncbi:G1 family endopeptidase [Streptomyces sp. SP17BM10]|uniref:G1 family glutamic endopeptidase n=1 Tax=Streptomyces sp. SP17BM10 TaxID=3002530 RepID=UPI002E798A0E|nr:G1 family glutamic endopeptidase [Streptomyces sp. SP17BM10]MEE1782266.1 G1 family endopeptidase [Streptomyces sp. SP17BM10]
MPAARHRTFATAALAAAATLLTTTPALAQPAGPAAPALLRAPLLRPDGDAHQSGPHDGRANGTSVNWAGYAATGTTFTSVSASWTQPEAKCTSEDTYSSFWVGLDGDGSRSVEQNGSSADCVGGRPQYYAWFEMYPAFPVVYKDKVEAGDRFTASVTATTAGKFTLTISDETQHWSHVQHKSLSGAKPASAEVIAEAPSTQRGPLPLTDFGTAAFTDATVNGRPIGEFGPENITMADRDGTVLASTSPLTAGKDFGVTWHHA